MMGINAASIEPFKQEGAAKNLKPLAPDAPDGAALSSGFGNLTLINKAPHPNAAKLVANWILSADGQKSYAAATNLTTRHVAGRASDDYAPKPGVKLRNITDEAGVAAQVKALEIAKEAIK